MSKRLRVDLEPIPATCGRCGNGTLTIYPGGAVCSNCSPSWLASMLTDHMEEWRKRHPGEVVGG